MATAEPILGNGVQEGTLTRVRDNRELAMRRPVILGLTAVVLLALSGPQATAGILGDLKGTLKAKTYAAVAKVQSLLPVPLPGLSHRCATCGIPVPKLKLPSLHKRRCIDPIRSPRDFFMLR